MLTRETINSVASDHSEKLLTGQINSKISSLNGKKAAIKLLDKYNNISNWVDANMTPSQLAEHIKKGLAYRASKKVGGNSKKDITSIGYLVLDFDDKSVADLQSSILAPYYAILAPSPSWTVENPTKNRAIICISSSRSVVEIERIQRYLINLVGADPACFDAGRFYFGVGPETYEPIINHDAIIMDIDKISGLASIWQEEQGVGHKNGKAKAKKSIEKFEKSDYIAKLTGDKDDSSKKKKKMDWLNKWLAEIFYDICEGDPDNYYKLHPHNFTNAGVGSSDNCIDKWSGSNPFSPSDSSGTSFVVGILDEGYAPVWWDRSKHAGEGDGLGGLWGGNLIEYYRYNYKVAGRLLFNYASGKLPIIRQIAKDFNVEVPIISKYHLASESIRRAVESYGYMNNGSYVPPLRYNMVTGDFEWHPACRDSGKRKAEAFKNLKYIEDQQDFCIQQFMVDPGSDNAARSILRSIAIENQYNPLVERLIELHTKHGPSLDNFDWSLDQIFKFNELHLPNKQELDLYKAVIENSMLASIGRLHCIGKSRSFAYEIIPIFQGSQGSGKSSFLRGLGQVFGSDYFSNSMNLSTLFTRDGIMAIRNKMVVELSEFYDPHKGQMGSIESWKSFTSQQENECRDPYAHAHTRTTRYQLIAGTSNKQAGLFLEEENRRMLVIPFISGSHWSFRSDAFFEKLWARAYDRFLKIAVLQPDHDQLCNTLERVCDLSESQKKLQADINMLFAPIPDTGLEFMVDAAYRIMDQKSVAKVTIADIWQHMHPMESGAKCDKRFSTRAGKALVNAGFTSKIEATRKADGRRTTHLVYYPPVPEEEVIPEDVPALPEATEPEVKIEAPPSRVKAKGFVPASPSQQAPAPQQTETPALPSIDSLFSES